MEFDAAAKLGDAGGRAKSDVANKLVSMVLHKISQTIPAPTTVRGEDYQDAVRKVFLNRCPYCSQPLDHANTVLEHLDAMNQFRAGLHVPGNVLPACRSCNLEKRRDDQAENLPAGVSGWERFLQHDGSHGPGCKTCSYWVRKFPDPDVRTYTLRESHRNIAAFRKQHLPGGAMGLAPTLAPRLQDLYADAQRYAEESTETLVRAMLKG